MAVDAVDQIFFRSVARKVMRRAFFAGLVAFGVWLGCGADARAQFSISVVSTCGTVPLTLPLGTGFALFTDINGNLCSSASLEIAPTAASAAGISPVVSSSVESSHVFKASAGNLYSAYVTVGATAGFLLIFDATSAPVDGAVAPTQCVVAPANQTVSLSFNPGPPEVYSTGITAVFSSTGCFTKTASATAFFHGSVK